MTRFQSPAVIAFARDEDLQISFKLVDRQGGPVARPSGGAWTLSLRASGHSNVDFPGTGLTLTLDAAINSLYLRGAQAVIAAAMPVETVFTGDLVWTSPALVAETYATINVIRRNADQVELQTSPSRVLIQRNGVRTVNVVLGSLAGEHAQQLLAARDEAVAASGHLQMINGCLPKFFNNTQLQITPGSISITSAGVSRIFTNPDVKLIDTSFVGLDGMSANYGAGPPYIVEGWYYPWAWGNPATGDLRFVLSQQYTSGITAERIAMGAVAAGYSRVRLLPFAIRYKGAGSTVRPNSIVPFFSDGGWPQPTHQYTEFDEDFAEFRALDAQSTASPSVSETIDFGTFMPETARMATILVVVEWVGASGGSGTARIFTPINSMAGDKLYVGGATSGHPLRRRETMKLATNSAEEIHYLTSSSDVKVTVYVRAFNIEEPS